MSYDNTIEKTEEKLQCAKTFHRNFGAALAAAKEGYYELEINLSKPTLYVSKEGCITAGELFGKGGWTRSVSYNTFNWSKELDGVLITIHDAEPMELNGTPVPASAFPIQLENGE